MSYKFIKVEHKPHRLDITLSNPPVNILTGAVMQELITALKEAADDPSLRLIVLKGEGKAWSAGADVSEHMPDKFVDMLEVFGNLCYLLRTHPIPTIAAVDGLCLGGGCEVACMCDFIVASDRAKFGQPEIKVGVFPPAACAHYGRRYGLSTALELILTGDTFTAEDFHRMGIVNKVVEFGKFEAEVDAFAARITANSGAVLRLAKRATLKAFRRKPKDAALKVEELYADKLMRTNDAVEGLSAFLEKRQPNWKDK